MVKKRFLALYLLLFSGCQSPLIAPAQRQTLPDTLTQQIYFSAGEGLPEARQQAQQWSADARLYEISSPWLEQGGISKDWSYHFYSAQASATYIVHRGTGLASPTEMPTAYLSQTSWIDSPELSELARLQRLDFPLLSVRLEASGIWVLETEFQILRIDAYSGHRITG